MPEYLAPGVYAEEVSFRAKTIEGLSTSTAGFVGPTRFGPLWGPPPLLTSFLDFERIYGGLDPLMYGTDQVPNHLAHGVRAFFENGGGRLYVARVYEPGAAEKGGVATATFNAGQSDRIDLAARHPGSAGNIPLTISAAVGPNIFVAGEEEMGMLSGAVAGDTVLVREVDSPRLYWLEPSLDPEHGNSPTFQLRTSDPKVPEDAPLVSALPKAAKVHIVTLSVTAGPLGRFAAEGFWVGLAPHPDHGDALTRVFERGTAVRSSAPLVVTTAIKTGPEILTALLKSLPTPPATVADLLDVLAENPLAGSVQVRTVLQGGSDGSEPNAQKYRGDTDGAGAKSALLALEDLDDISIVAAPGSTRDGLWREGNARRSGEARAIQDALLAHCERMRYRFAVLDTPDGALPKDARSWRGEIESRYGALYYPWVRVLDPFSGTELVTPPSSFVAGIYARNDVLRGVHKAPANEVVRLALDAEIPINRGQQEVLNPEGINCLRFLDRAGLLVWGARTTTRASEWKYVNVRRYFLFLEHSIDKGTRWAVFEPNGPALWDTVRRAVETLLFNEFKLNRLLGSAPEEAYFVKCDRSTMTQEDIDNGRLVCLVGVAPLRPAEFVIFRIGQMTLEAARR